MSDVTWKTLRRWKRRRALEPLVAAARDSELEPSLHFFVARYLASFRDPRAVEALLEYLAGPDQRIHAQAARSLGAIGDDRALPALLEALFHRDRHVRIAASQSLAKMNAVPAIQPLLELTRTTDDDLVHSWATSALVELGAPEAVDLLVPYLEGHRMSSQILRGWDARFGWTRRWAARKLGEVGGRMRSSRCGERVHGTGVTG